ncbi:zinc finger CCCH domain containing protein 13 [Trypanosoma brucei equiperdum]|uniref:Zinc finger CCCH domain containing protein 13 n=1 Tax=Trypanosoma brucei equiperdum TaxID=630700 RepID=A0A3L6L8S9_9TRYP|nr:zinc finger CCCH domain containing protein 13 [Trypanosoma brucei equiperdum]
MARNRKHDIVKASKYKTSLCTYFMENGECQFGDRCAFAHGEDELRHEEEGPKSRDSRERGDTNVESAQGGSNAEQRSVLPCASFESGMKSTANETTAGASGRVTYCSWHEAELLSPKGGSSVGSPHHLSNSEATVPFTEDTELKGVKPPPKITKGKLSRQNRANMSVFTNKARGVEAKSTIQPTSVHYPTSGNNVYLSVVNLADTSGQLVQLAPGAFLFPFPGAPPPYVGPFIPSVGIPSEAAFGDGVAWISNGHMVNSFVTTRTTEVENANCATDLAFRAFDTVGNIPVNSGGSGNRLTPQSAGEVLPSLDPSTLLGGVYETSMKTSLPHQPTTWSSAPCTEGIGSSTLRKDNDASSYDVGEFGNPKVKEPPSTKSKEISDFRSLLDSRLISESLADKNAGTDPRDEKNGSIYRQCTAARLTQLYEIRADRGSHRPVASEQSDGGVGAGGSVEEHNRNVDFTSILRGCDVNIFAHAALGGSEIQRDQAEVSSGKEWTSRAVEKGKISPQLVEVVREKLVKPRRRLCVQVNNIVRYRQLNDPALLSLTTFSRHVQNPINVCPCTLCE